MDFVDCDDFGKTMFATAGASGCIALPRTETAALLVRDCKRAGDSKPLD